MSTRSPQQRARDEARVEDALMGKLLPACDRRVHSKVVGVTANNVDGSSRQRAIAKMAQFDSLELVHNPNDEWDTNAVQVFAIVDGTRIQIGHIAADLAAELAPRLDGGEPWAAIATRVGGKISLGVSLMLFRKC